MQLLRTKPLFRQPMQQQLPCVRHTPDLPQLFLILEELRQPPKQHLHKLLRRNRCTVRMPECRGYRRLNRPRLPIAQFHHCLALANAGFLAAHLAHSFHARAWPVAAHWAIPLGPRHTRRAHAWILPAILARFRIKRVAIPFRIAEMMMSPHKIPNRKIIFPVE